MHKWTRFERRRSLLWMCISLLILVPRPSGDRRLSWAVSLVIYRDGMPAAVIHTCSTNGALSRVALLLLLLQYIILHHSLTNTQLQWRFWVMLRSSCVCVRAKQAARNSAAFIMHRGFRRNRYFLPCSQSGRQASSSKQSRMPATSELNVDSCSVLVRFTSNALT